MAPQDHLRDAISIFLISCADKFDLGVGRDMERFQEETGPTRYESML
jgi:hypothetical protein